MSEINWRDKCWVTTIYLVRENDKVLLTWNKNLRTWIPVGGHINPGETPEEAILREVREETGFQFNFLEEPELENNGNAKIIKPYKFQIEKVPHHNHHMNFIFIGKCTKWFQRVENDEQERLRWFSEEEIENENMLENVKKQAIEAIKLIISKELSNG